MSALASVVGRSRVDVHTFDGPVLAASAWPALNVEGRRVGVFASSADNGDVLLEIVKRADLVKVFHRHPGHVLPSLPLARLAVRSPRVARAAGRWHLRVAIRDKEMRRQLTPVRTRTVTVSNRWYRAMRRPNCQLITWPVTGVTLRGVRTADGVEHVFDMLILA